MTLHYWVDFQVSWRPVLWGLLLQLLFALVVLRTSWGYDAFDWLANRVTEYLEHSETGAAFVFGPNLADHLFAFTVRNQYSSFPLRATVALHVVCV